ncbi:MAG TPA: RNA polymerase sigma factor [Ginsengibacter sp.]|nr:RNA polymerase sigma factor [Ginsengibacter sp.]HRP16669.1 RNA polymerase sigma factor [Ginsengibacter sp.]HRP43698.1 RNA polymerase sigma factor [Ginsengibacter sp.]
MKEFEYNECVRNYADNVYRFVLKNLRNEEDARDVVQSSFEKLWINRNKIESEKAKSFLFTVAYHQLIDLIRKNKRITLKEDFSQSNMQSRPSQPGVREILNKAIYKLSDTQRSLVLLKDYEGYSYEEIAEITSLSISQVKVYLHRARIQLKHFLIKPENVI